jgi:hypothetical protein
MRIKRMISEMKNPFSAIHPKLKQDSNGSAGFPAFTRTYRNGRAAYRRKLFWGRDKMAAAYQHPYR